MIYSYFFAFVHLIFFFFRTLMAIFTLIAYILYSCLSCVTIRVHFTSNTYFIFPIICQPSRIILGVEDVQGREHEVPIYMKLFIEKVGKSI